MHIAHEWGVRPASVLEWGMDEFALAVAYLHRMAELRKNEDDY